MVLICIFPEFSELFILYSVDWRLEYISSRANLHAMTLIIKWVWRKQNVTQIGHTTIVWKSLLHMTFFSIFPIMFIKKIGWYDNGSTSFLLDFGCNISLCFINHPGQTELALLLKIFTNSSSITIQH